MEAKADGMSLTVIRPGQVTSWCWRPIIPSLTWWFRITHSWINSRFGESWGSVWSSHFVILCQERQACDICHKSRKFFCYTCHVPLPSIRNLIPRVQLPIQVTCCWNINYKLTVFNTDRHCEAPGGDRGQVDGCPRQAAGPGPCQHPHLPRHPGLHQSGSK